MRRTFLGFQLRPGWRWMVFQGVVMFAIAGPLAASGKVENGYVIGLAAWIGAYLATVLASLVIGVLVSRRALQRRVRLGHEPGSQEHPFPGLRGRAGDLP